MVLPNSAGKDDSVEDGLGQVVHQHHALQLVRLPAEKHFCDDATIFAIILAFDLITNRASNRIIEE